MNFGGRRASKITCKTLKERQLYIERERKGRKERHFLVMRKRICVKAGR